MARTKRLATTLSSPPIRVGGSALFYGADVEMLAASAGLSLNQGASVEVIAGLMNRAFMNALQVKIVTDRTPSAGALEASLKATASKARELLLVLGIADDPKSVVGFDLKSMISSSSILNHLVHMANEAVTQLPVRVLKSYQFSHDDPKLSEELAAKRFLVEAVRGVAFLCSSAESWCPDSRPRGQKKKVFRDTFFDQLTIVYRDTFGEWPRLRCDGTDDRGGPAYKWIYGVLRLTEERLKTADMTEKEQVAEELKWLVEEAQPNTLGSRFEKSTTAARRRSRS